MAKTGSFAEVVVDIFAREADRVFQYRIPPFLMENIKIGSRVLVPFRTRKLEGFVIGFSDTQEVEKVKDIIDISGEKEVLSPEMIELARWVSQTYLCPLSAVLNTMAAPKLKAAKLRFVKRYWPGVRQFEKEFNCTPKQAIILKAALKKPGMTRKELAEAAGVSPSTVDAAASKGILRVEKKPASIEERKERFAFKEVPKLNQEQLRAVSEIKLALEKGGYSAFLLYGVTGSGKTEVYMRAVAKALALGRQSIILVPELSMTPQMVDDFQSRFGDRVAVLHSALSRGERYDGWRRVESGRADIVLGARSAVFAPVKKLGLIVVDEEHEPAYKQEDSPRYHAREVALERARLAGATVVLGSATPSLETYCRALKGGFKRLNLYNRVDGRPLPEVKIVDLRKEVRAGNRGIFSRLLLKKIGKRLDAGEQVILFLNRRGHSTFVICRECGRVLKCPHCDISLTYHVDGKLRCHYCNYVIKMPNSCPSCGSVYINYLGVGTQKVEDEIRHFFPQARILRMDSDTTQRKGTYHHILKVFQEGEADVLIGTQMVAKGLNLQGVTLVGVVNADSMLYLPDFRSAERAFQLLTQVAGRAGRGKGLGEVIIQTYTPGHYSIVNAKKHGYLDFLKQELPVRYRMAYPPFIRLVRVIITGRVKEAVTECAQYIKNVFVRYKKCNCPENCHLSSKCNLFGDHDLVEIMGPAPAPLGRIKDAYRWQIILKGFKRERLEQICRAGLEEVEKDYKTSRHMSCGLRIIIDVDPYSMF